MRFITDPATHPSSHSAHNRSIERHTRTWWPNHLHRTHSSHQVHLYKFGTHKSSEHTNQHHRCSSLFAPLRSHERPLESRSASATKRVLLSACYKFRGPSSNRPSTNCSHLPIRNDQSVRVQLDANRYVSWVSIMVSVVDSIVDSIVDSVVDSIIDSLWKTLYESEVFKIFFLQSRRFSTGFAANFNMIHLPVFCPWDCRSK